MVGHELANFPAMQCFGLQPSSRDGRIRANTPKAGASLLPGAGAATRALGLILELSELAPAWLECPRRRSKRAPAAAAA
jgi:hypothetical protein